MSDELIVHVLQTMTPVALATLRAALLPNVHLVGPGVGAPTTDAGGYHVLVAGRMTRAELDVPMLHTVIIPWAGLPGGARKLLRDFPQLAVHNLHYNAETVAEYTLMLLLAAAKRIVPLDRALRCDDWRPRYRPNDALMLGGQHAVVLGYGAIGQRVARLCQGIGMRVSATRRSLAAPTVQDGVALYPPTALGDLLPTCDALISCLPLTDETQGVIGAAELAQLPPTAIVVNVGRGPTFDEQALYTALREGAIWAAGLDVWYTYPTDEAGHAATAPSRFPFGDLDNVVLSPHHSSSLAAHEDDVLMARDLAHLLNAAAQGEALPNRVDVVRGY